MVLLNDTEGKQIRHARGLRQGDPLSPYLFILAIDALHRVLEQATADGILSPLRGREAKLRLSLYADDAMVFLNPVKEEVAFFDILDRFGSSTGLRLNLEKCIVAPIRCAELNLDNILDGFAGKKRMNFPLTYLGLPLTLGRTKMAHVQGIIDGSRCRLAGWQGRLLNPTGRRELVRFVLTAIPIYLMTSIRVHKQLIEDIDKLRHRFLWAGDSEISGGKCKVAWTAVTKPVEFGGLGVIELQRFSRALRLRWLWFQWTNPERPWNGTKVPVDSTNLALFNAATTISIGDGRKTSFWHNNWLNGETP
jgi:hypothetical protein